MIFRAILITSITAVAVLSSSCGGKQIDRPAPILTEAERQANQAQFDAPAIPSGVPTGSGVKHYTCPNGHDGADAQGACVVCGTALVHNQAFHNQTPNPDNPAPAGEPPQNAVGVWHYTCPNGHDGGAGSAVACSQCGTTLVHNTVYHDQGGAANPSSGIQDVAPPTVTSTPPAPEPAQNAAGVWHYTCPNGHEGGDGSATACGECGTTRVHNQAYH